MASSFTSSSSSSKASPPPPPPQSPLFSPINETEYEHEQEQHRHTRGREREGEAPPSIYTDKNKSKPYKHHPTPLHHPSDEKSSTRKRSESNDTDLEDRTVSCNKCRPTSRDKISVIPLDINGVTKQSPSSNPSPNGFFKSILSSITKKSPKSSDSLRDDQWKLTIAEISNKLIQATQKRDEALLEASRLKYSMAELEKKLNKLEIYCHNLKSGLEVCSNNSPYRIVSKDLSPTIMNNNQKGIGHQDRIVESFLNSVSESRSAVRLLSRSLTVQLRQMGGKVYERISTLLQPYEVKIPFNNKNPRSLLFYLEALLNRAFHEDFESIGFQKSGSDRILNPIEKCQANYASFTNLQGLIWEEVLSKGTKHFSEDFSRFCDRKMNEIVAMLGWNRAWPEPLLHAFFSAAKGVWLVHLLACSVHPSLPIFRVDKGMVFDGVYMEDMGGDKARKLVPNMVRVMVAPGFYIYNNAVKCKVLCSYTNNQESPTI